jgi:hypothetical protein
MTINKVLLGDTLDYHKNEYMKKIKHNFLFNKKQECVIRIVCTFGYSNHFRLKIKMNRGHTMLEIMGATSTTYGDDLW